MANNPETTNLCDCKLSHNGLGMSVRECDCPAGCIHDFSDPDNWRDLPEGHGGERVCVKCGIGARQAWSDRLVTELKSEGAESE